MENFDKIVEIGAQQLAPSFLRETELIGTLYDLRGKPRPHLGHEGECKVQGNIEPLPDDAPSSREFWQTLGFDYKSIEFDGHRDSIALDLNGDSVPPEMIGRFNLVINAGTTEHVANQDNSFRVIHDLTALNGIMIHELPAGGMMSHGIVNYNAKFFWHLCRDNNYEVLTLRVMSCGVGPIPQDVIVSNLAYGGNAADIAISSTADFMILASIRKVNDRPFVTPLDIPGDLKRQQQVSVLSD